MPDLIYLLALKMFMYLLSDSKNTIRLYSIVWTLKNGSTYSYISRANQFYSDLLEKLNG